MKEKMKKFGAWLLAAALAFAGSAAMAETVTVTSQEELIAAVNAIPANGGGEIILNGAEFTLYKKGANTTGKSIAFIGQVDADGKPVTTWNYGGTAKAKGEGSSDYSFDGAGTISFKNVIFKDAIVDDGSLNYCRGFVRAANMAFENCKFGNMIGYWGTGNVSFKGCLFDVDSTYEYSLKLYSGDSFFFDGCIFMGNKKGYIQAYCEKKDAYNDVVVKDCIFIKKADAATKMAIYYYEYGASNAGSNWNMSFVGNNVSDVALWGDVKVATEHNSTITENGVKVWENGAKVASVELPESEKIVVADVADAQVSVALVPEEGAAAVTPKQIESVKVVLENAAVVAAPAPIAEKTTTSAVVAALNEAAKSETAVTDSSDISTFVNVSLAAAETKTVAEQTVVKAMTFEVKPIAMTVVEGEVVSAVIPNAAITEAIVFRLPVDANATETKADVFHNGDKMGTYDVATVNDAKYIEVASTEFSTFAYTLKEGGEEPTAVAKVIDAEGNEKEYETLQTALNAAKDGETVMLLADVADVGAVSLKGITFDGNGKKITGESALYLGAAKTTTVKNVVFENIHNDSPVGAEDCERYGFPEGAIGTQSAIYAEGFSTGSITITGCTFDNVDWDAIQIVPVGTATGTIAITDNIFKHTDKAKRQLRYVHIQCTDSYMPTIKVTATDNQMFDCEDDVVAFGVAGYGKGSGSVYSGNYISDASKIDCAQSYDIKVGDFYPMRSQPTVDVDDIDKVAIFDNKPIFSGDELVEAINACTAEYPYLYFYGNLIATSAVVLENPKIRKLYWYGASKSGDPGFLFRAPSLALNIPAYMAYNAKVTVDGAFVAGGECTINNGSYSAESFSGNFVLKGGTYDKDVSALVDPHVSRVASNGDGTWTVSAYTAATAVEDGRPFSAGAAYFCETLQEAINSGKSTDFRAYGEVKEDIDCGSDTVQITLYNQVPYSGSLTGQNTITVLPGTAYATPQPINFTSVNCPTFKIGGGNKAMCDVTIGGGEIAQLEIQSTRVSTTLVGDTKVDKIVLNTYYYYSSPYAKATLTITGGTYGTIMCKKGAAAETPLPDEALDLTIIGGTFGFDPAAYVDTKNYDVIENATEPKTWTVQAKAVCQIGDVKYPSIAAAVEAAPAGVETTIKVIADHEVGFDGECSVNVVAGQKVVIDLNGHSIDVTATRAGATAFIKNNGQLTICDSAAKVDGHFAGSISFTATNPDTASSPTYGSDVLLNQSGTLIVAGGKLFNKSPNGACYVIDNNSGIGDTFLTVNGGELIATGSSCVRLVDFNTAGTCKNEVVVNGGFLQAKYYSLRLQTAKAPAAKLTINGGEFASSATSYDFVVCTVAGATPSVAIAGGVFNNGLSIKSANATITGGIYKKRTYVNDNTTEELSSFVAEGYEVAANAEPFTKDDYPWAVAKKAFVPAEDPETGKVEPITIDITPAGGTQAIVPVKVSEDAVKAMVNAGIVTPAGEKATAAEVSDGLAQKQNNDQTVWQNYVMGIDGTTEQNMLATIGEKRADKPEEVVVVKTPITEFNPPQNTGVTVTYNLLRKRPGETKFSVFQEGLLKPEVDVNTIELDVGDTLWKFEAVFSAEKP